MMYGGEGGEWCIVGLAGKVWCNSVIHPINYYFNVGSNITGIQCVYVCVCVCVVH